MKEYENAWKYVTDEQYEIAEKNGISRATVTQRVVTYIWPVERAITEPVRKVRRFTEEEKMLMQENKLKYNTVYSRKKAGWSEDEIFKYKKSVCRLDPELIRKAKENGISYELLYWRKKQCWSDEEASTRKPSQSNKQIRKREVLR